MVYEVQQEPSAESCILIVDDVAVVRANLREWLEAVFPAAHIFEATSGEQAVTLAESHEPDVVVMDVALPGQSGIETTRRLLAKYPDIKVLALSTHLDRRIVQQMLDVGARGYIVKSAAGAELKQGIRGVVQGRSYLCAEVGALVADSLRGRQASSRKLERHALSRRELQVATLLAEGRSAPEIAGELHISPSTVDVHRRNLMRKLEVHNVVELTKYAIRTGLVLP